ncbi:MAG: tRNA (adenosine(37)-N6)-threonylcarbamoyltransferase complex dimerization subunit type 1 TsaB [Oscillospiraceae bacterium]|nr:tRNA (adenosine(37)-N6)-threonylcarbamoyltransferase complex dimerization subunit type 1 TsaB [Oscillospiraceae bacterium]
MRVFALETGTRAASAAISEDRRLLAEAYADIGLTHSETAMVLADEVFRRTGLKPADMDCFAAATGPGSFTGLRIGLGIIKGLAFAAQKPCADVPTLEALAFGAPPGERIIVPVLDARRSRVYTAAFLKEPGGLRRLESDCVLSFEELAEKYKGERVFLIGDAAAEAAGRLASSVDCLCAAPEAALPRASFVAAAAFTRIEKGQLCSADELRAEYLQPSQAERLRKEREGC